MFGINQSKNASSNATNLNTTDSNNDNSYGSHNTDQSGSMIADTHYDSHSTVTAGQGSTVNVADGGVIASVLGALKGLVGGGPAASAGEQHYDGGAAPAKGIPTWAWVVGGVGLVLVLGGVAYAATRK